MVPSLIIQIYKSLTVKIYPEHLYDTSIEEILYPNDAFKIAKFI